MSRSCGVCGPFRTGCRYERRVATRDQRDRIRNLLLALPAPTREATDRALRCHRLRPEEAEELIEVLHAARRAWEGAA